MKYIATLYIYDSLTGYIGYAFSIIIAFKEDRLNRSCKFLWFFIRN